MRMFIPTIGTKLRLTEAWSFRLCKESRNHKMIQAVRGEVQTSYWQDWNASDWSEQGRIVATCTLPIDTVLSVDRIYIRKGLDQFDSITFQVEDCPEERFRSKKMGGTSSGKPRFWVRLDEANTIEFDLVE